MDRVMQIGKVDTFLDILVEFKHRVSLNTFRVCYSKNNVIRQVIEC